MLYKILHAHFIDVQKKYLHFRKSDTFVKKKIAASIHTGSIIFLYSLIVDRWWKQYQLLPWPGKLKIK